MIDDMGRDIARSFIRSDLAIFLSPVTFGGYSSELKKGLDRSIGLMMPFFTKIGGEVHHKARYKKYPSLMGIGVLSKKDEESERIFKHCFKETPSISMLLLMRSGPSLEIAGRTTSEAQSVAFSSQLE